MVRGCDTYCGYTKQPDSESEDNVIDHIFLNSKADALLFNVIVDHDVEYASDHIPIYADIKLN